MSEWSKEHAWKVCVLQKGTKGSNPFLSATYCETVICSPDASKFPVKKERCPSGRRSTPGKCVYSKRVPRVRIPFSPLLSGNRLKDDANNNKTLK